MSDTYDVDGVSIAPSAGGYYDLSHPSLPDGTERVQGKDKAEQRAKEIAAAGANGPAGDGGDDDGRMEAQAKLTTGSVGEAPKLPDVTTDGKVEGSSDKRSPAEKRQETDAVYAGRMDNTLPGGASRDESTDPKARDAEMEELRRQFNEAQETIRTMKEAAGSVTTVLAEEPAQSPIPLDVSRNFQGEMSKEHKAAFKKAGIDVRTIVLEESENIPPTGLFISHNGRAYVIKPGEEVDVPKFLTDVLDDAIMSAPVVDSSTQKILGYRNRSRYPYRVVKG